MTLDEAIKHVEEVAEINENIAYNTEDDNWMDIAQCEKCAEEHRQLADWLKDYKRLLEQEPTTTTNNNEPITVIYPTIVCDDAISREDAEQMFRNIRCHLKPQDYKSAEEFNTRDLMLLNAEQMIHALPSVTQKSGKWIKRTDRLPEDKTYVLTTIKVPNRVAHARSGWYECGFFHNDNGDTWRATDMEVKAWMPLPEPYEPQESEEQTE
jgi:hypothetical protein